MVDILRTLIGTPPVGFEAYEYIFAGLIIVMFVASVISLFSTVARTFGRGR